MRVPSLLFVVPDPTSEAWREVWENSAHRMFDRDSSGDSSNLNSTSVSFIDRIGTTILPLMPVSKWAKHCAYWCSFLFVDSVII